MTRRRDRDAVQILAEVARELAGTLELTRAAELVASSARRLFRVRVALLYRRDPVSGALACVAAAGGGNAEAWRRTTLPADEGVAARAAASGGPIWSADVLSDPTFGSCALWRHLAEQGCRSVVLVPLIARRNALGVLLLADRPGRGLRGRDLALLAAVADQAALTLENARLYEEAQRRLQESETLLAVSQAAESASLDLTETMRRVARQTALVTGADMVGAYLADPGEESLRPIAGYHVPKHLLDAFLRTPIPLKDHRFLADAWRERRPAFSDDAEADPRIDRDTFARFSHRSVLFVPMIVAGRPRGGLFLIWWKTQHRFIPDELRLVEGISRQSALAIRNARLFASQREEAEVSGALLKLAEAVGVLRDLDGLLETVTRVAPQLLGLTRCGLFVFDPAEGVLVPTKAWGLPDALVPAFLALRGAPQIPAVAEAVKRREPFVVDPGSIERWIPRSLARVLDIRSMLIIPLVSAGRLMGTMALDSPGAEHAFTPKQIAIARGVATHAAVAIDNARLFEERRRALADLEAAQEELVRRETLRATGELAIGMAHHLNNLLQVVLARSQLLRAEVEAPQVRQSLAIIEQATGDAAEVVRRVLGLAKLQPDPEPAAADLGELAEEALELARSLWQARAPAAGRGIDSSLVRQATPEVIGDPAALREVLLNLLLNAGEALPEGGTITVRTWTSDGQACCAVSDSGKGMAGAVRRRAVEPFFTTKGPRRTGLGLSVAYATVQRHGGTLTVESIEGRGTTVTIRLPAASATGGTSGRAGPGRA